MTDPVTFTPPLRATGHCRHYSYHHGDLMSDRGPECAAGCDLTPPAASRACWPSREAQCADRQEYTNEERAAGRAWVDGSIARLGLAIDALPAPIPLNTRGQIVCPNCSGDLHYGRWHRGAFVQCNNEHCCGARFSIEAGADWPNPTKEIK